MTFTAMKRPGKILFNILILLAVFFSIGLISYSNFNRQQYITEFSTSSDSIEDSYLSDFDNMNEDLINHTYKFGFNVAPEGQKPLPRNCPIIHNFSISVWQPPKIF
jgi:hypothetical protein